MFSLYSSEMDMDDNRVAIGPLQGMCCTDWEALTCILCQEEQEVEAQAPAMVLTACVQRSTVLTQCRGKTLSIKGDNPFVLINIFKSMLQTLQMYGECFFFAQQTNITPYLCHLIWLWARILAAVDM